MILIAAGSLFFLPGVGFVGTGELLPTAAEAEQWLDEHRQTAIDVMTTFRVLEPFDA